MPTIAEEAIAAAQEKKTKRRTWKRNKAPWGSKRLSILQEQYKALGDDNIRLRALAVKLRTMLDLALKP